MAHLLAGCLAGHLVAHLLAGCLAGHLLATTWLPLGCNLAASWWQLPSGCNLAIAWLPLVWPLPACLLAAHCLAAWLHPVPLLAGHHLDASLAGAWLPLDTSWPPLAATGLHHLSCYLAGQCLGCPSWLPSGHLLAGCCLPVTWSPPANWLLPGHLLAGFHCYLPPLNHFMTAGHLSAAWPLPGDPWPPPGCLLAGCLAGCHVATSWPPPACLLLPPPAM